MILGVMGHELGSLAAAVSMRADALLNVDLEKEQLALKEIGAELRQLSAAQRALRSAQTAGRLSPLGPDRIARWWGLFGRIVRATTPRRLTLTPVVGDGDLQQGEEYTLTLLVIALIQDVAERGPAEGSFGIQLTVGSATSPVDVEAHVTIESELPGEARFRLGPPTRWQRYAQFVCGGSGVTLSSVVEPQLTRHSFGFGSAARKPGDTG
jgi:hypothetical protein